VSVNLDESSGGNAADSTPLGLRSTIELLARGRAGDSAAIDALLARSCPALRRWARGRLPLGARDMLDTADIVQDTIIRLLNNLESFEARHEGALQAYLRQAILNRIRDEARRIARVPPGLELEDVHPSRDASPLERVIGVEGVDRYDRALQRMSPTHREAVILRIELQYSYQEIAEALGSTNANAARSVVVRAMYRLHEEMQRAQ
jgi:RNA polymerase sigma-70 factor (ECF subfamily)